MDKSEKPLDVSIEDISKEVYCKDVVPTLTKNATVHFNTLKVTTALKQDYLNKEHAQIDEKIKMLSKKIKRSEHEMESVDKMIYTAKENQKQALTRSKRTNEIIKVLKDETDKIKTDSDKREIKLSELTKKVSNLLGEENMNQESKKQIQVLEEEIKKILELPEPKLEEHLVQENMELKKKLESQMESLKQRGEKRAQIEFLKYKRLDLLSQFFQITERNKKVKEEIDQKEKVVLHKENNLKEKLDEMQKSYLNDEEKRNILLEEIKVSKLNTKEIERNTKEMRELITEKEAKLKSFKEKIEIRQNYMKEENHLKQREYEEELEKLKSLEQKIQEGNDEIKKHEKTLSKKSEYLLSLKEEQGELIIQLCENKNQIVIRQHQNAEQQTKIDMLAEKIHVKTHQIEEMKIKNQELDATMKELDEKLEQLHQEWQEKSVKCTVQHKEKIDELIKQQNFQKASMEFLHLRLDGNLKKIEILKKEIKEQEDSLKWEDMKYEMRKKTAEKLQEKTAKEQVAYEALLAQLKQKETKRQKTEKNINQQSERSSQISNESKSLENKISSKENAIPEIINLIENEHDDIMNGRKSPGILKSPFKKTNNQHKKVTFEGLSSESYSSASAKSPESDSQNFRLEDVAIDELLESWDTSTYPTTSRKRQLDF